ncbi:MAG: hypothetical protein AAF483_29840, partial [Planctomycetota bacterium]
IRICGLDCGSLFYEHNWQVDSRVERNKELAEVCEEYDISPPPTLCVFLDYLGDFFWCFELGRAENPAVILFDLEEFQLTNLRFDEFIMEWDQYEE